MARVSAPCRMRPASYPPHCRASRRQSDRMLLFTSGPVFPAPVRLSARRMKYGRARYTNRPLLKWRVNLPPFVRGASDDDDDDGGWPRALARPPGPMEALR